ncbi:hypothetical protein Swit_4069 [Rhizorhabdus wittichii RW1]|uniref:Uncharacterized protein n=1 Tax=Rhizorhabdus wittichii (strain DSM 6014 / CCUG 31198 / JCM 15750 / NBRC 105917 / EY 4224 / RW1) TaxID=392499 RepID=A0A9J9LE61_RHIWR|nr:hypothetical protein Swit_4069 [Rhizorhabdus wittichii RW1]
MAKNLAVGEMIYVPAALVDVEDLPSAFLRTAVEDVAGRKVRITFRGADHWIASSRCQRNVGLLIICISDWATEATLLDPLSKTVLQFCRLLVPDDQVRFYKVRSIAELRAIWVREHATYSHVILIGHGNGSAVQFANDRWQTAAQLDPVLSIPGAAAKYFVNLACQGGQAPLGKPFSSLEVCDSYIGAFHSVHGAIASQFLQSFLIHHLLQGETTKVAFRHARERVSGGTSFRLWRHGALIPNS